MGRDRSRNDHAEEAESLARRAAEDLLGGPETNLEHLIGHRRISTVTGSSGRGYELVMAGYDVDPEDDNVEGPAVVPEPGSKVEAESSASGGPTAQVQVIVRRWKEEPTVSASVSLGRFEDGDWRRFLWPAEEPWDLEGDDSAEGLTPGDRLGCLLLVSPWFVGAWYLVSRVL